MLNSENFKFARRVEEWVAIMLAASGYRVLEAAKLDRDGAPMMHAIESRRSLILPDIMAARGGSMHWVEVKQKDSATLHRKTMVLETGVDLAHWQNYVRVEAETGAPLTIVFYHMKETEILCGRLAELEPIARAYRGSAHGKGGGMAMFPYHGLRRIGTIWDDPRRAAVSL
jgi:hypothetical protein